MTSDAIAADDILGRCLDAAMQHYPTGTAYTVKHGQTWEAAAYEARRKEIEPLVRAVMRALGLDV